MDLRRGRRILLFLVFVCCASGAFADNTYHQKETDDYVTLGELTVEPGKVICTNGEMMNTGNSGSSQYLPL